jgi:hypothetical protein
MRSNFPLSKSSRRGGERGYAMLLAIGLIMLLLVTSTAIVADLRTQGRRQREEEAIWRGNQYARAIRLYFHKTGKYPQTLEDLTKGMPQLHFLRQAYKDPLNKDDGSWRFIYVNAAGQIIGSTRYSSLQQMALLDSGALQPGQMPGLGTPVSSLTNSNGFGGLGGNFSSSSNSNSATGSASGSTTGAAQNPTSSPNDPNAPPTAPGQASDPSSQNPPSQNPQSPQGPGIGGGIGGPGAAGQSPFGSLNGQPGNPADLQKPTGPVDGPVLGAFLTGVASKVDKPSQKVYHHGKKYIEWEFIWNPLEDAAANAQQMLNGGGGTSGIGQAIGQGIGQGIGQPTAPTSNPFGPSGNQPPTIGQPPSSPQMPQQ